MRQKNISGVNIKVQNLSHATGSLFIEGMEKCKKWRIILNTLIVRFFIIKIEKPFSFMLPFLRQVHVQKWQHFGTWICRKIYSKE
jgi:hypothetical protein